MQTEKVWEDFAALPLEAQKQVADFVAFLRQRVEKTGANKQARKTQLAKEPFIGMWADRTDMHDSTK